ncbi:hypothetical protein BW723_16940 [Polaribacter reichenbachii]|uniref:DUF4249 domain-containing protein n=1 Tax=Polaribacter reichenbachii TaxID=996801 RepID=A0A1B8U5Q2_9FLAO|nr:DUF4249 domain-containing protein [Polaribacter reichenbachii]APZ47876.1 hypothetical protein BW723_16940 [Polaribacter reichenbachii]AUC18510.1 hypothetical protein BTO17_07335 [Polaribacter reichenbachii]OBY67175.1 hypothetical protein LPB301_03315 [Polaribacter reichenbachii]
MKFKNKYYTIFFLIALTFNSCVEEFEITSEKFEDLLVIEAVLTNEVKNHEITLSRTYPVNALFNIAIPEESATVKIIDDLGTEYKFSEGEKGIYTSNIEFGATTGIGYKLYIKTNDGEEYSTQNYNLPDSNLENEVYFDQYFDGDDSGVTFYTKSNDPTSSSKYYRYEFEGTYKIVAPLWSPYELVAEPTVVDSLRLELKTREEQICFKTERLNGLTLRNTSNTHQDVIDPFIITSISRKNSRIAYRYSMLVNQYVLSREAYSYYEVLQKYSDGQDNVFSENQPGFVLGNIFDVNEPKNKVIGFFDVSKVYSKRIYFDYYDFYLGEIRPNKLSQCPYISLLDVGQTESEGLFSNSLWTLVKQGSVKFIIEQDFNPVSHYWVTYPECGDCNYFGTNIRPDFWED